MRTGLQNQEKLWDGYAKIAYQLGRQYEVYPYELNEPLEPSKKQDDLLYAAFSADANFVAPQKHDKAAYYMWADGRLISQRDFLVGPAGTFYVGDMQPLLPLQAVRCNKRVTLVRGGYSQLGPLESGLTPYASGLPVFMQFTREDIQKPNTQMGQQLGRAITHWTAFIPAVEGTIKQDDILLDEESSDTPENRIRYLVDAPDFTQMGYVCHLRLATL